MADISITAANVALGSLTVPTRIVQYGEAVTQSQPLYRSTDGKWYKCDANDTAAKAVCGGVVITPGAANGYGVIALPGTSPGQSLIIIGGTLSVGMQYAVSTNAGGIRPITDAGSTEFITTIGTAISTTVLDFVVTVATVARA
jgi:hypothetical protein